MVINPKHIELSSIIGLDLETTGLQAWNSEIDLIAIKTDTEEYILEVAAYSNDALVDLFRRVASECTTVLLHNSKFDCGFIYHHYHVLLTNTHCTEMSAEICENGKQKLLRKSYNRPFSLTSVLKRWMGVTHADKEDKRAFQLSFTNKELRKELDRFPSFRRAQMEYAMEDVRHLRNLYAIQMTRIEELELQTIYKLEHKLLPVLVKMEMTGCLIDREGWAKLIKDYWEPELIQIEKRLDEEVSKLIRGKNFKYSIERSCDTSVQFDLFGNNVTTDLSKENELNYASSEQVIELFKFLGQPVPRTTKIVDKKEVEVDTVGEEALTVYLTETVDSPLANFIEILLEHRKVSKLISTYGYEFLANLDQNNHIHTLYTQTKTETGRLSSKHPNLQNIPKPPKNDPTKDVRRFFIARPGYKFITCDMAGAEVAIAADYSQEPILLDALRNGADMHSDLASVSFSIIFSTPTTISKKGAEIDCNGFKYIPEELRDEHKSVVFAKFYKGGAKRVYGVLSKYINRHWPAAKRMDIASEISKALDLKMPKLSAYLSGLITKAQKQGFLRTSSFGRIRFFDSKVYGEAANAPIQGTNSEAIKIAMINLDKYFCETEYGRLVMNIHDELVCEVKDEFVEQASKIVQIEMASALSYFLTTIKGGASVSISDHWKK